VCESTQAEVKPAHSSVYDSASGIRECTSEAQLCAWLVRTPDPAWLLCWTLIKLSECSKRTLLTQALLSDESYVVNQWLRCDGNIKLH